MLYDIVRDPMYDNVRDLLYDIVGTCRFWRDIGYGVGAIMAGQLKDVLGEFNLAVGCVDSIVCSVGVRRLLWKLCMPYVRRSSVARCKFLTTLSLCHEGEGGGQSVF